MGECEIDEEVFLATDAGGLEFTAVVESAHPGVDASPGAHEAGQGL